MGLHCFGCGSPSLNFYKKINNYSIYQCNICKLLITKTNIRSKKTINKKTYSQNYIDDYLHYRKEPLTNIFRKDLIHIEKLKAGGNLLDVGCGPGVLLQVFKNYSNNSWKLFGIDINELSLETANKLVKANYKKASVDNIPYNNNYFDCVCCYDVLEHVNNITDSLKEIRRVLKREGLLVIQMPNYLSLMQFLSDEDWDWWCIPDHVLHFNPYTIIKILEKHNFKVIDFQTRDYSDIFIKNIQGHFRKRITKTLYLNKLIAKLAFLPLYLIWLFNFSIRRYTKLGGLIYIIAQKV